ncbi:MAG: hypothetical protein M3Y82_11295, partial [Verrucomicrobiota bacterium]|nr:hypothetical protein [Verrucomicrobiota bacterium]
EMKSWLARVTQLKQRLDAMPDQKIPELKFVTEQDWLNAGRSKLDTEVDYRKALSQIRHAGENKVFNIFQPALKKYFEANNGQFPTDLSQLQPYFKAPVDEAILQRYEIAPSDKIPNLNMGGDWIITQKAPVDEEYDERVGIGPRGYGSTGSDSWKKADDLTSVIKILDPAMKAYATANNGKEPALLFQLQPYITTPEQKAALEKILKLRKNKE